MISSPDIDQALGGLQHGVDRLATVIELFALAVLLAGVIRAVFGFLREGRGSAVGAADFLALRRGLGVHILLALEILICADIMHTVVRRSYEELVVLAGVVVIRTVIAFFLNRELREAAEAAHAGSQRP